MKVSHDADTDGEDKENPQFQSQVSKRGIYWILNNKILSYFQLSYPSYLFLGHVL